MSRIFITGSADGLGQLAAQLLLRQGHQVVLHARNDDRAQVARAGAPGAAGVAVGDLSTLAGMRQAADQANALGPFDVVIHNAGVGFQEPSRGTTADGLPTVFAVNSLAPYVLTCLLARPARLVYLSSGLHRQGQPSLHDLTWSQRPWSGYQAYCDSKLHDVLLAFAVARRWPQVLSNAVTPGWVATKMGGPGAPDSLAEGPVTQAWLAVSNDPAALVSGRLFYHQQLQEPQPAAFDTALQDGFLTECARLSGVELPAA
jgi:NAD(P)-dependent dehydrogenase (short-subunit alcohol dehydrogenase family)